MDGNAMEFVLAVCLGIGLSAACGFRVFVPLLGVNLAVQAGHLNLAEGFDWIGSPVACAVFATATVLEIGAYYVPWIDNLLDSIATPAAVVAGTVITAALVKDMSPMLQWTLAAIAGGGTAAVVQTGTVALRGASSATTAGLGNFVVSTGELGLSSVTTVLAMLLPITIAIAVIFGVAALLTYLLGRFSSRSTTAEQPAKVGVR